MRKLLKNLLFSVALLAGGGAIAGNQLDGVYLCTTTATGFAPLVSYNVVITNAAGETAFGVLNAVANTTAYGYGFGAATATSFVGTDSNGKAFSFAVNPATRAITGTGFFQVGTVSIPSSSSCLRVW